MRQIALPIAAEWLYASRGLLDADPQENKLKAEATEARNRLDTALMTNDPKTISEASVMCEVVCRGACACFGIQYDEAFLAFLGGHPPLAA